MKAQRLYQYFYDVPRYGYYKIVTYQRYDPLIPDRFQIKCFKRLWLFFWKCKSTDSYHNIVQATDALKDLQFRFKKLNGTKIKEINK